MVNRTIKLIPLTNRCWVLVALMVWSVGAAAMDPAQTRMAMMPVPGMSSFGMSEKVMPDAIDNSIDPDTYIIGGGDQFFIAVIQMPSLSYTPTVNDNGDIFISDLGIIKLGPVTLTQARELISQFLKTRLKKEYDIYVSLKSIKTATVSVAGAIDNPGTYQLRGTLRLLDAIKSAQNGSLPALNRYNYREVKCSRGDSVWYCDLFQYMFKGDRTQNPYVYPGDNVLVGRATQGVILLGKVLQPIDSLVPLRTGETLGELLSLFSFQAAADSQAIIIARANSASGNTTLTGSLNQLSGEILHDQDVVTIAAKAQYQYNTSVGIYDEVKRPGVFPMVQGHTTVQEVLDWAGGFTDRADVNAAFIYRASKSDISGIAKSDKPQAATSARPEITAAIANVSARNDMTLIPYKSNESIVLEPSDRIVIPRKDQFIYISGNVRRPGAYLFKAGKDYRYYINQAGGYTEKADQGNVFALMRWREISQVKDPRDLQAGNVLVVPDAEENKQMKAVVIPVITIIATVIQAVATVVLLVQR